MEKSDDEGLLVLEFLLLEVKKTGIMNVDSPGITLSRAQGLARAFLEAYPGVDLPKNGTQETD